MRKVKTRRMMEDGVLGDDDNLYFILDASCASVSASV